MPQARHQGPAGGPDVGGADGVQGAVGDGPADEDGQDDRERRRVARDQHREGVEEQHDPQHRAPAGSAGHADGRHVRDDRGEVAVHGVGQRVDVTRGRLGERLLDGAGSGLGDPQVGGEGHSVCEDRRQYAVGDPQPVPFDQPLDRERDGHQEDRDAGGQSRDLDEQVGSLAGALVDVLFEARGGAVREGGDGQEYGDGEHAHQEAHQVGGPVHARGEQRFVALDLVDVGHVVGVGGRRRGALGRPLAGLRVARVRGVRARGGVRGALGVVGVHTLLLHRLFLLSYHWSPPARWWHAASDSAGIRVPVRAAQSARSDACGRGTRALGCASPCRRGAAGWVG
ncbi:hypothetical protein RKD40_002721 [Streptomyces ambofaciens]